MVLRLRKLLYRLRRFLGHFTPMQIIALVFLAIVLTGAVLLTLPVSSRSGETTPFLTALFTATSGTCVTGLTMVDTYTHWSGFGQVVILCLIQIGGLGFMSIATMFFFLMKRRIRLKERLVMAQSIGMEDLSGIVSMIRLVLIRTLIIEGVGALILAIRFAFDMPFGKALWWGVFHSISVFCNGGFDIMGAVDVGGSVIPYATDPVFNITVMALIILGGLGFFVWDDILRNRRFKKLSLYSRMVLVITAILIFGGAVLLGIFEWNNPETMGNLTTGGKIWTSLFHSVTCRTAGCYTIPQMPMTDASKALSCMLMFVGGSSGSTAGGVKTVTVGVLLLSVIATARGRSRVTVGHRTVAEKQVKDAIAIASMVLAAALGSALYLSAANGLAFMDCLYETMSAIATVGLSTGITASLDVLSLLLLIVMMFFGRVGVMTISLGFLLSDQAEERYRFAETKLMIG